MFASLNLVRALRDDFEFEVVTRDRDLGDTTPYSHASIESWRRAEAIAVRYLAPEESGFGSIARIMREIPHDLLVLNSVVSPQFALYPLLARRLSLIPRKPLLLSPHGELASSARAQKAWKKRPYLAAIGMLGLLADADFLALSAHEEEDIRRVVGPGSRVAVIPPMPAVGVVSSATEAHRPKQRGKLITVFLSRIDQIKNLDVAIRLIAETAGATLDIYGPVSDTGYWLRCRSLIETLHAGDRIRFCGGVDHRNVPDVLARYDLFLLPTGGENFGFAILEALAAGCPVLTSDRTPWKDFHALGLGATLPLEDDGAFRAFLQRAVLQEEPAWHQLRERAVAYARNYIAQSQAKTLVRDLFLDVLHRQEPACGS